MSSGEAVSLRWDGGLAVVTFDSPPLNLFDAALSAGLDAVVDELSSGRPRTVLFRAEGRVVSGGVDVAMFAALSGPREAAGVFAGLVAVAGRVELLPCPTVFAAHALCLTWAFELALACDLILAAESARFGLVEKVIGLTPAMGGTQRLAERAGGGRAKELVMAGRPFAAGRAGAVECRQPYIARRGF
jgi:enoyl-CoA hydratase/carnithine racemase